MASDCIIAPSPYADWMATDTETEVELSRKVQGKVYRKHILNRGVLLHPVTGTKIDINDEFIDRMKRNFTNNVCDIVQVPLANDQNAHVENPAANLGEVVGIEDNRATGKVYALVDARKHVNDFGKTLLGASAFFHLNYKDSKSGQRVGPTLLHVAVTNRPYVTGLDPYEAVVAASAEDLGEPVLVQMSGDSQEVSVPRPLADVLAELNTDHQIDVDALRTQLSTAETAVTDAVTASEVAEKKAADLEVKLSAVDTTLADRVAAALAGSEEGAKLSKSEGVSDEDVVKAVTELANRNVALSAAQTASDGRIAALETKNAEIEVDRLISEGRILPAKREVHLTMCLTNREMFDQIVPDEPIVKMSVEQGIAPQGKEHDKHEIDIEAEIARLTAPGGAAAQYVGTKS
jgi:hypothetical protein